MIVVLIIERRIVNNEGGKISLAFIGHLYCIFNSSGALISHLALDHHWCS